MRFSTRWNYCRPIKAISVRKDAQHARCIVREFTTSVGKFCPISYKSNKHYSHRVDPDASFKLPLMHINIVLLGFCLGDCSYFHHGAFSHKLQEPATFVLSLSLSPVYVPRNPLQIETHIH
ncbi:hypothetical protein ANANG_G00102510 [Anguilla anguilla]|uniref:Uncharacterized protein n=1 Tax=Anguilla anguilla TaxID=7936 RepID=A0A9D3MJD6_ANGAN|nr:hypothetical protein ANANG_G00102510 [Anguilla anguilla]